MTFGLEALRKSIRNSQRLCLLNVETRKLFAQLIVWKVSLFDSVCANFPHQFFFFFSFFAWQYECLGSCMVCSLACMTSHSPASKPTGTAQVGGWSLSGEPVSSVLTGGNVLAARRSYFTSEWLLWGKWQIQSYRSSCCARNLSGSCWEVKACDSWV